MSLPVIRLRAAREDIVEISIYLMEQNQDAAERFLTMLQETLAALSEMPEMGIIYKLTDKIELRRFRVRQFENYLIFYQALDDRLELVRVIYGTRDIPNLLEDL